MPSAAARQRRAEKRAQEAGVQLLLQSTHKRVGRDVVTFNDEYYALVEMRRELETREQANEARRESLVERVRDRDRRLGID